ncbi:MAG: DUF2304 domain-containing protein [Clostridium sp.]|uniref:DUF2304 domain-containing protein n=1 Tax=Clostridium sp. DSM 8431 TaxID=1761781 RepID=UPI0008E179AD|nr:DUF2304 domain-containing protein [Clostridium sp. DSM 8431]MCR4944801.1 DUF2304 domain-containing protein [Clostridium sp.]SFU37699.1 hypothetical protein SAMN04487886_10154 [Clostridium sp. DSM 8431]
MEFKIRVFFGIAVIIYLCIIVQLLKKKKLDLKYTLLWLLAAAVLLFVTIFPGTVYWISEFLGISTPINSALVLAGMFIIVILITITSIVSGLNSRLRSLTQEIALLEKRVRELSKNSEENHE